MTQVVLLNNVDHADLRVRTGAGARFGDDLNRLPVFPAEFEEAQRDYPIVFRAEPGGGHQAVVLLGFDPRENLFSGPAGWSARHVPAVHRRGPLSIGLRPAADGGNGETVIHVDLDHPRVSRDGGEPLFLPHGGNAPLLEAMADALRVIHEGQGQSRALSAALAEAGLLQPVALDVEVGEGRRYRIADVWAVAREGVAGLDPAALARLHASGFLPHAVFAAASLGNLPHLAALKRERAAA